MAVVLVVDDGPANRQLVQAYLAGLDVDVRQAEDGASALEQIKAEPPDLVLLDVQMPGMDGYEVCRRIKAGPRGRLLPVVMITALNQTEDRVRALESGADDFMAKPVERVELVARVRSALRLKALYNTLDSAEQVIFALATAVEAKDALTERHTQRVGESARHLGARLGMPEVALDALYRGGVIHDIGKIGVPDAILLKPGPLDAHETEVMRSHVIIGDNIVRPLRSGSPDPAVSQVLGVLQNVPTLAFVLLGVATGMSWARHRDRSQGFLALAIILLSLVSLLGRVPQVLHFTPPLLMELNLILFVGSSYALLRFRGSLIPLPR